MARSCFLPGPLNHGPCVHGRTHEVSNGSANVYLNGQQTNNIQKNEKIPAYGASARSSTLLNFCGISSEHISVVIDKNPLKNGLITAGSNIPIISFKDGVQDVKYEKKMLLLAWNFQDEIVKELRDSDFEGEFIIPLPGNPYIL